jgi:DNA-binding MarR family transcriptional regulator
VTVARHNRGVTRMEYRGPFLLLYALNQQLDSLLTKAMTGAPLRPGEFAVYSTLRLEQPTTPSELAAVLGLRLTTMSSHLAKMTTKGHLARSRNPRDGRSTLISLTPDGLAATEACFASFSAAIETYRRHATRDEEATLAHLESMSDALTLAVEEIDAADGPPVG